MNGDKRTNVTVKVNGHFFEKPEKEKQQPTQEEHKPRVRIQGPSMTELEKLPKREDAWDRMQQLRDKQDREPQAPQHPLEYREEIAYEEQGKTWRGTFANYFSSFPKGPVVRTMLSTGGAIAIGLAFGFMVLSVFSQEQFSSSYRSVLNSTVETLTAPTASLVEKTESTDPALTQGQSGSSPADGISVTAPLQLAAFNMYVAQAGVFQPDASAQQATEPLDQLGLPHLLYSDGEKQYMFAAAAPTRDAVLGLASGLKSKGIEVFVKEFAFPGYEGQAAVGKAEGAAKNPDLALFFSTGLQLANTLSSQSGMATASSQPVFPAEQANEIKQWHRQFLEESRLMQVPEAWEPYFQGMVSGINQAVTARDKMEEAFAAKKTESAESYAWQVQAGVLGYLEQYAKWVRAMGKNA